MKNAITAFCIIFSLFAFFAAKMKLFAPEIVLWLAVFGIVLPIVNISQGYIKDAWAKLNA